MILRKLDMTGITVTDDYVMLRLDWKKNEKGNAVPGFQKNYPLKEYGSDRLAIIAASAEREEYRRKNPVKKGAVSPGAFKRKLKPGQLLSGIAYTESEPRGERVSLKRYFRVNFKKGKGTAYKEICITRIRHQNGSEPFSGTRDEVRKYELSFFREACKMLYFAEKEHYPEDWRQWIPYDDQEWLEAAFDQILNTWITKHGDPRRNI